MKKILIGACVFVGGGIFSALITSIFGDIPPEFTYYYGIIFSILYLASVVTICTLYITDAIKRTKPDVTSKTNKRI